MKYLLLCFAAVLFESTACNASQPASYTVRISQANVEGDSQLVICHETQACLVPIVLKYRDTQKPVMVHVMSSTGVVTLKAQTLKGNLYIAENADAAFNTTWHKVLDRSGRAHGEVTLFLPEVPEARIGGDLTVTHDAIADLWITVEPTR